MEKKLQDKLFEKYPNLFRQKDMPPQETAMCWGVSCGDGWYDIIDSTCSLIQSWAEHKQVSVEFTQVKEKYATLRIYHTSKDDYVMGVIRMAEKMSSVTCEKCGNKGELVKKGWLHTLCNRCSVTLFSREIP